MRNENNILEQIGDDPWVQGSWKFTVAWFLFKVIAVVAMFIAVVVSK